MNWITLLIGAAVLFGAIRWVNDRKSRQIREIVSEWYVPQVVFAVTRYVDKSKGRWPRKCDDLALSDDICEEDVLVDFAADPDQLIDDPNRICSVVLPLSGTPGKQSFTETFDELRRTLVRHRRPELKAIVSPQ